MGRKSINRDFRENLEISDYTPACGRQGLWNDHADYICVGKAEI
jgi:hypothetical protein